MSRSSIKKARHAILLLGLCFFFAGSDLNAQLKRKVLFLGNSYTAVNNLPQITRDAALSVGDTLVYDSHTPGGYRLDQHNTDQTTIAKLMAGGWDYVVLQEQSQRPVTNYNAFQGGALSLSKKISQYALCSVPMLYITWGRENGDAANCPFFPEMCTYEGMDSTLRNNYLSVASYINAEVSPVSVVWNQLRNNHPGINLYQADGSHPSPAGSYAAACCFYTCLFKKDPSAITFDYSINPADAATIRNTVKTVVFNHLNSWDCKQPPVSAFSFMVNGANSMSFNALAYGTAETYFWDFGDGSTASTPSPAHTFADGTYTVSLTTTTCDLQGTHSSTKDTVVQFCSHTPTIFTRHPWLCSYDSLWTQAGDAYQWFHNGVPIPDTTQFLPNHSLYNGSGLSVETTINGCAELSIPYTEMVVQPEFYFFSSPWLSPCNGDTAFFVVLHNSGSLSGSEIIEWYRNDTLLPLVANDDTLLITQPGSYTVKVVDPNALCPKDTVHGLIEFNCNTTGLEDKTQKVPWHVYPNPASQTITIAFADGTTPKEVFFYNAIGHLTKTVEVSSTTTLDITDLPNGLYFIQVNPNKQAVLKFIKQ